MAFWLLNLLKMNMEWRSFFGAMVRFGTSQSTTRSQRFNFQLTTEIA
jgi:hypothetical protein